MSQRLTCPQGHEWDAPSEILADGDTPPICPECGTICDSSDGDATIIGPDEPFDQLPPPPVPVAKSLLARSPQEPAAPAAAEIGQFPLIPGYDLLGKLGHGGMGVVYKARQAKLDRLVALKMISVAAHASLAQRARFRTEAEAVAQLQHPNIVQVYDIGEHDGCPFIALEFVEGGSLADRQLGTPLASREAAAIVEVLAGAMAAAHQRGIVHRDLKPENILLTQDGIPKIADFGLAKRLDQDSGQTRTGAVMGTPSYMAPEQAGGKTAEVGPAADLYSLGAILYELLTGRPPHRGETTIETLRQVTGSEPAPPRLLNPAIVRDLETVCLKCLAKSPSHRYRTAGDLAADLKRFCEGLPVRARRVTQLERAWRWCLRNPLTTGLSVLIFVLLIGAISGGLIYQSRLSAARRVTAAQKETVRTQEYYRLVDQARRRESNREPGWRRQALEDLQAAVNLHAEVQDNAQLRSDYVKTLTSFAARQTAVVAEGTRPSVAVFDPDSRHLAIGQYFGHQIITVRLVDVVSNQVVDQRVLLTPLKFPPSIEGDGVRSLAYSSDGHYLAAGPRTGTIHLWDETQVPPRRERWEAHQGQVRGVAFSPDGRRLYSGSDDGTLAVWSVEEPGRLIHRADVGQPVLSVSLNADGTLLACATVDRLLVWRADDLDPYEVSSELINARIACFAPEGRLIATSWGTEVSLIDVETGKRVADFRDPGLPKAHEKNAQYLAFDPGGSILASSEDLKVVKFWDVASGTLLQTMLVGGDSSTHPAFSPDGRLLSVTADEKTLLCEVGGPQFTSLLARLAGPVKSIEISSDGSTLACLSGETVHAAQPEKRSVTLWSLDDGRRLNRFDLPDESLSHAAADVVFHPDGKELAALGWPESVHLINPSSEQPVKSHITKYSEALAFSSDGSRLWSTSKESLIDFAGVKTPDAGTVTSWQLPEMIHKTSWSNTLNHVSGGQSKILCLASGRSRILAGSADTNLHLLDPDTGRPLLSLPMDSRVPAVAVNREETHVVAGNDKGLIRLFQLSDGRVVGEAQGHTNAINAVEFSPDGRLLASAARDGLLRLWDFDNSLAEILTLRFDDRQIIDLKFTPDGTRLLFIVRGEAAVRQLRLDRLQAELQKVDLDW